jgi:uncharacterized protein YjiS (DUF1127 family)
MMHHFTASPAARETREVANARRPARDRRGERPGTALEELLERWINAGLPRRLGLLCLWLRRARDRHELADLSETQLRDVGLEPNFIRREIAKPFWQA